MAQMGNSKWFNWFIQFSSNLCQFLRIKSGLFPVIRLPSAFSCRIQPTTLTSSSNLHAYTELLALCRHSHSGPVCDKCGFSLSTQPHRSAAPTLLVSLVNSNAQECHQCQWRTCFLNLLFKVQKLKLHHQLIWINSWCSPSKALKPELPLETNTITQDWPWFLVVIAFSGLSGMWVCDRLRFLLKCLLTTTSFLLSFFLVYTPKYQKQTNIITSHKLP